MASTAQSGLKFSGNLVALSVMCLVLAFPSSLLGQVKTTRDYKYKVLPASPQAVYVADVASTLRPKGAQPLGPGTLATGFEAADGFTPGFIEGQAGWSSFAGTTEGNIDTANPAAGSQHFRIAADASVGAGSFTGAFSPDLGPLPSGASTVSVDIAITATGGADYLVAAQSPSEGFLTWQVRFGWLGNILVLDDLGGGFDDVDTGVAWAEGPYKNLTVCDDPIAGTTDYFYGGGLIYSQATHVSGTRVEQVVFVSDNWQGSDAGDFDNFDLSTGLGAVCTAGSVCGNDTVEPGEACDGTDDAACPGLCDGNCACPPPVCGNNSVETGEACDGTDDAACPGLCLVDCSCGAPPAPANDDCADSEEIFVGATAVDTTTATLDGPAHTGHASCDAFGFDQVSPDIWYHHFATCDGDLTVTMCEELGGGADYDTRIAVYAPGCPASDGSLIDCNDDDPVNPCGGGGGGFHSTLTVSVTTGQEVLIRIGGFDAAGTGVVNITCGAGSVCGNDIAEAGEDCDGADDTACPGNCSANCSCPCGDFADSAACSTAPRLLSGSTVGAADTCGQRSSVDDIWEITITESGEYNFNMATNAPGGDPCAWDSYIYLMDGCCSGTVVDFDDDCPDIGCFGNSCIECIQLDPGTYYLVVEGFGSSDAGDYVVTVDCCTAPVCGNDVTEAGEDCDGTDDAACPGLCDAGCACGTPPGPTNDDCADSEEIFVGTTAVDTTTATLDGPAHTGHASCDAFGFDQVSPDIWYHHFATCTGDLTVDMCEELGGSATYDTRIAVYAPGCPATDGSLIDCNDDDPVNDCGGSVGGFHSTVIVPVTSGQEVLIRIGGFDDEGAGTVHIACDGPTPICGDDVVNQASEDCDGTDAAACPGQCRPDCTCPPPPTCGDNLVNQASEECDGTDAAACPGACQGDCTCPLPTGACCDDGIGICENDVLQSACGNRYGGDGSTCATIDPPCTGPTCGDNVVNQVFEDCDGTDAAACPGACLIDCTCPALAICGDNVVNQASEACDGTDDLACPGECLAGCTCPSGGGGGIPTVSQWGLAALALLLLVGARVYFGRRFGSSIRA